MSKDKRDLFKTNLSRRSLERAKGGHDAHRVRHDDDRSGAHGVNAGQSSGDAFGAGFGDNGSSSNYSGPGFSTAQGGGMLDEPPPVASHRSMNDVIMSMSAAVPEMEDPRKVDYSSMRSGPDPESRLERHEMAAPVLKAAPDFSNEPTNITEHASRAEAHVGPVLGGRHDDTGRRGPFISIGSAPMPETRAEHVAHGQGNLAAAPTFDLSGEGMSLDEALSNPGHHRTGAPGQVAKRTAEVDLSQFGSLDEALGADHSPRHRRSG